MTKQYRAVIDGKAIYYDQVDLVTNSKDSAIRSWEWLDVAGFLRAGNTPDRFTGLHDKNGVAIYEGDRIDVYDIDVDREEMRKRDGEDDDEWDYSNPINLWLREDVVNLSEFRMWLENESFGWEGEDLDSPYLCEVIGNIHITPTQEESE